MQVRLIFRTNYISYCLQYSSGCYLVPLNEDFIYECDFYILLEGKERVRRNIVSMELEKFDRIQWCWRYYRNWELKK